MPNTYVRHAYSHVPKYCTFVREGWQSEFFSRVEGLLGGAAWWRIAVAEEEEREGSVVSTTYVGTRVNVCSQPDTHIEWERRRHNPPFFFFFLNRDISYFCWILVP